MKVKELQLINKSVQQLDVNKKNVQEALQGLQANINKAQQESQVPQLSDEIEDIKLQLKEIALAKQLKEKEKALGEIELNIDPFYIKGKVSASDEVKKALKGLLFE